LLIALVVAALSVVSVVFREGWWREATQVSRYVGEHVAELREHPRQLKAELDRVRETFGVEASIYATDGKTLLASSADPPFPPRLAPGATEAEGFPGRHGRGRAMPLPGGGQAVFVFVGNHMPPPLHAPVVLLAVLVVIALASVPLARSIAAPVERLTQAARAIGAGDLTTRARVRARGEVGELAKAFDEMAERIEAQMRSEKELLANVSHEVRTPLARIRVALELASEGDLERARRYLGEIGADLDELDRLVEGVLSAARLDLKAQGAARVGQEKVDLGAVVEAAARRFAERWPGRVLVPEVGDGLPAIRGDASLLRRLIDNLLDNAAKYSGPEAPVRLLARAAPGEALLEVRDRGIGIGAEDLPRLFTPFFRTDRSRARGTGGVGLGLALAQRIARAHGGEVEVESGEETVFRVRLPAG
jgi:signal transduction histidine kinase